MSNLLKSVVVCSKSEAKIIDNNAFISRRITEIKELITLQMQESAADSVFTEGLDARTMKIIEKEDLEAHAREIIEDARDEAKRIIDQAVLEAEEFKGEVFKKAKDEAYEEALREAAKEIELKRKEFELQKQQHEEEYLERLNAMEPILVDAILKVFNQVTHVLAEDKKELILYLVNSVMKKTEMCRDFIIRASKEDYTFLLENMEKIHGALTKRVNIEIIEDPEKEKNQCIIETDSGIYDCSLDIQMENLIKDIKTLSCMLD